MRLPCGFASAGAAVQKTNGLVWGDGFGRRGVGHRRTLPARPVHGGRLRRQVHKQPSGNIHRMTFVQRKTGRIFERRCITTYGRLGGHERAPTIIRNYGLSSANAGPRKGGIRAAYESLTMDRMRAANCSIANGLLRTCMPGSRWPLPTAAFSAYPVIKSTLR